MLCVRLLSCLLKLSVITARCDALPCLNEVWKPRGSWQNCNLFTLVLYKLFFLLICIMFSIFILLQGTAHYVADKFYHKIVYVFIYLFIYFTFWVQAAQYSKIIAFCSLTYARIASWLSNQAHASVRSRYSNWQSIGKTIF